MTDKWDNTVDITKDRALELAQMFIGGAWAKATTKDIHLSVLGGGFSSRLYILELLSDNLINDVPKKVLIRLLGGKLVEDTYLKSLLLSEANQAVILYTLGQLGLSPKLLGQFDGGRMEEFIPSRTLSAEDLKDPEIRKEFARKLARYHIAGQNFPIDRRPQDHWECTAKILAEHRTDEGQENFRSICKVGDTDPKLFLDFPIDQEIKWLKSIEPQMSKRIVWSLVDMNRLNCLIREEPDQYGGRLTLIDYELAAFAPRAADIGAHFNMWALDLTKPGWVSGLGFPDEDIRRQYCREYLAQTEELRDQLNYELDPSDTDSVDQLLIEVDYYTLWNVLWLLNFVLRFKAKDSPFWIPEIAKNSFNFNKVIIESYDSRKREFREKYKL